MIFKEKRQVTRIEEYVVKTTCDLCGKEIKESMYEINEVTIECRKGSSYPDGGDSESKIVDMCSDCFEVGLLSWLKEKYNVEPRTEQRDW